MHPPSLSPSIALPTAEPGAADRALAVAAYLGCLVGLWLIAPLAVYVLRRRCSRFAAHHAAQAALLQLLFGALLTVCLLLAAILGSLALFVLDPPSMVSWIVLLGWGGWLVPVVLHLVLTLRSVWRAGRGRVAAGSRLGRMAEWLLAHDPGLPPRATG